MAKPSPVVHFEIHGKNAKKMHAFYGKLFNWKIDPIPEMQYGMVDAGGGKNAIDGGIANDGKKFVTVYVQVKDINATLAQAKKLGGKVVMPRTVIPDAVTMAMFKDPEGNRIGLIEA